MLRLSPALRRILSAAFVTLASAAVAVAQTTLEPVLVEAETGTLGAEFALGTDSTVSPAVEYIFPTTNFPPGPPAVTQNPGTVARVVTYTVTFPAEGTWQLYARVRVGPAGGDDDSMYYGNGFGIKTVTLSGNGSDGHWTTVNQLNGGGYVQVTDRVVAGGPAGNQVWKWVKLSGVDWGDQPANFVVPAGALTQTFQIGGRENGLRLDKFAFGQQGVFFTVGNLNDGEPGTTEPPPPPYVPPGPPLALDLPKFLGSASSPTQDLNFNAYFNQVTPENGGKWGSVEGVRDVMNWNELDAAYNLAKNNVLKAPGDPRDGSPHPLPFRLHTLVWGNQQPNWMAALPPAEQLEEIEEWFAALAERYPGIDQIDVVNEPLHDPPDDPADGGYIEALGGSGVTGWDWVIKAFELAREHFPNAELGLNEFSVTNDGNLVRRYIEIIDLLKARGLIDTVGVQGHAFSTRVPASVTVGNLDTLATAGLPIYVTEFDIDGSSDAVQLADYQRNFPAFWTHPAVRGITLWGYRPGLWRHAQGAYIVLDNGAERPAMVWLKGFVPSTVLAPWITGHPASQTATVEDTVSFSCAGDGSQPLAYQWRKGGEPIAGNASAATATLTLEDITTADAGSYDCVVSNAAGSAASAAAVLTVDKAAAGVLLANLTALYDGAPHAVTVVTEPPGLAVVVTYDGATTPPTAPGAYAVVATVNDANYVGVATGTLVITTTALVRHAPVLNGRLDGSLQLLLPEGVTLNGGALVSGDLLVPGTPIVRLNGRPAYEGTLDGDGAEAPSGYAVTLNGGATLRHVVRRTDPVALPTVSAPLAPTATRDIVLNTPGQDPGDFATLRNVTLNGNVGVVAVPPGRYGTFVVNGHSGLTLGVAGTTEAAVYDLQGLALNGGATLHVVGPVVLNLASGVTVSGSVGAGGNAGWLTLNIASGGLTVNGNAEVSAFVVAPTGTVMLNGALAGGVASDRLVINGGGRLTATP
jgi:GH35 family endo-1,4-beta-xylanase